MNGLQRAIQGVSGTTSALGTNLQSVGNVMMGVGRTLTVGVTVPILAAAAAAVSAGIDFESAFSGIGKTVEGVMDSTGQLTVLGQQVRQEFRDLALEIPIATNELASLGEVVGQLGVQAEDITEVTEIVAQLGVATELSAEDAARGLIRFGNILDELGENGENTADFLRSAGSAIVALGNASVSTEGEILNLGLRLAAAGERANFSAQEILAWATTLSDLGVRAEAGGSAVSRAINEMLLAINTGSDNLATFAAAADTTVDAFVQAFEEDASNALSVFIGKLKEGIEDGSVSIDMLNEMGLSGIRATDILGRLGNAEELFGKNLEIANKAWKEQVALQEEFNKRAATVDAQIQLLKNSFTDLGITIFDLVKDDLVSLINGIRDLVKGFKNLDPSIQKTILQFALIAAAVGPVLIVLGGIVAGIGLFISGITALLSPIGLATAAIAGLTGALALVALPNLAGLLGDLDSIKDKALEVLEVLGFVKVTRPTADQQQAGEHAGQGPVASTTLDFQMPSLDTFVAALKELTGPDIDTVIDSIGRIRESLGRIFETISNNPNVIIALDAIQNSLSNMGKTLAKFSLSALEGITNWLKTNEDELSNAASLFIEMAAGLSVLADGLLKIASPVALGGLRLLGENLSFILNILQGDWEGAGENMANAQQIIVDAAKLATVAIIEAGIALFNFLSGNEVTLAEFFTTWQGNFENMGVIVQTTVQNIIAAWNNLWTSLDTAYNTWWTNYQAAWAGNWDQMKTIVSTVWDNIKKAVESKTTELSTGIQSWWAGFTASWTGNWDQIKTIVNTVWDNIKKSVESKLGAVKSVIDGVTSAITAGIEAASDAVKGPIDSIAGQLEVAGDAFGDLGGAAQGAAGAVQSAADKMIAAMQAVLASITGSPELAVQHPFEDFNKFLETTPFNFDIQFGSKIDDITAALSSTSMPSSGVVNNNQQTNVSIGDISGVQPDQMSNLPGLLAQRAAMLGVG